MQFAQVLSKLMEERGITQYRLAKMMDISQSTISGWLSGASMPRRATLKLLAGVFGVSVDYLLGKENPDTANGAGMSETKSKLWNAVQGMTEEQAEAWLRVLFPEAAGNNDQDNA